MKLVFRCDGDGRIGGGHVMRCLTLATAAAARGWDVTFVMAEGGFSGRVTAAGFQVIPIPAEPVPHDPDAPAHATWLSAPWQRDAEITCGAAQDADWLIWDHYGLDGRWAKATGSARRMAFDDLDDRPLASDVLLDLTRLQGRAVYAAPVTLSGPAYAPLRPEFARLRQDSLRRRGPDHPIRQVIVMPGLADAVGLAPLALDALADFPDLRAEVVMGPMAQSLDATRAALGPHTLSLDPPDLAQRMAASDLCIGASGMTNWERCALGLPSVAVAVADNQVPGLEGLAKAGAVVPATLEQAQDRTRLVAAIRAAIDRAPELSRASAALCDGSGADRVLDTLDWRFRTLRASDEKRLYHWRNQPHIRTASHTTDPLDPDAHHQWVTRCLDRSDGIWAIYEEGATPLGFVSAIEGEGGSTWSFYLGEQSAPGTGSRMMLRCLTYLAERGVARVIGEVKAGNAASIALHKRLGFAQVDDREGVLVFARSIGETSR